LLAQVISIPDFLNEKTVKRSVLLSILFIYTPFSFLGVQIQTKWNVLYTFYKRQVYIISANI